MDSSSQLSSKKKNMYRLVAKIVAWIHIILSSLTILWFMWEFTDLSSNAPVEEFVRSLVTDTNEPGDYTERELMEMTIGFLVGEVILHTAYLVAALSLLSGTRKDSVSTIKYCFIAFSALFLLSCLFLLIEIRHESTTNSITFNAVFLLFQGVANVLIILYLQVIQQSRKADARRQRSLRSNSSSSDLTELYI